PFTFICNYTFDCIKQDIFVKEEGVFKEHHIGIRSRFRHYDTEKSENLKELQFTFESHPCDTSSYYQDATLNQLLAEYNTLYDDEGIVPMPIGAIDFIKVVQKVTNNKCLLICGDKGIALEEKISLLKRIHIMSYDGCYSFMVNFHALGRYTQSLGGDYLPTKNGNDFKVCLYALG